MNLIFTEILLKTDSAQKTYVLHEKNVQTTNKKPSTIKCRNMVC